MKNNKSVSLYRRPVIIAASLVAVLLVGFLVILATNHSKSSYNPSNSAKANNSNSADKSTSSNAQASPISSSNKDAGSNASQDTQPGSVSVFIIDASQYNDIVEVRAYADTPYSGTCHYTFSNGQQSFTKTTTTTTSATTNYCATLDVNRNEFTASGNWTVTVQYVSTSGNQNGTATKTIIIT